MLVPQQAADDVVDDVTVVVANVNAKPTPPSPTPTTTPPPLQQAVTSTPPPSPHQSPIGQPLSPPQQQPPSHLLHDVAIFMDLLNTVRNLRLEKKKKFKVSGLKRLGKIGTAQRVESSADTVIDDQEDASKQGGIIAKLDADEDVTLEEVAAEVEKDAEVAKKDAEPAELKEVIELSTTVKLMTKVVTIAATNITAVLITAAILTATHSAARGRKGVVIRDPEETSTPSIIVHSESKSKNKGIGILHFNSIVGFLEKSKEQLEEETSKALKRKSRSSEQQAAKKHKLDEEVEEIKTHLQIVPNNEDDVYTEATPLTLKVPVVDY
uniref:Uncharacterized protein n=1 Tax=Tanacetum cinerariifolium TaxID=118510 RepID=A0A6L2LBF7_TANCI|nr:hypothetical protein [Tanacetum cinerariifolium]